MLGRGSGMQAWYNSLGLVPHAASMFTRSLGDAAENIAAQQRADNAEERRRRDIKTAKREARQSFGLNAGLAAGGAIGGAALGTALMAPVGAAAAPVVAGTLADPASISGPAGLGASRIAQTAAPTITASAPTMGGGGYGWLGNTRGQVFGNLLLQGLAPSIPGLGGVAAGINQAQQMNYQMGRDTTADQFRNRSLGLQEQGLGLDREQLAAEIANQKFNQGLGAARFQETMDENQRRNERFGTGQQTQTDQFKQTMALRQAELENKIGYQGNRLALMGDANEIARMRAMSGGAGGPNVPPIVYAAEKYGLPESTIKDIIQYQGGLGFRPLDPATQSSRLGAAARSFADPLIPPDISSSGNQQIRGQFGGGTYQQRPSAPPPPMDVIMDAPQGNMLYGDGRGIEQLNAWLQEGRITQQQYDRKRRELGF